MKFVNADGQLELRIAGYELDECEQGEGFNCLNVDGEVWHRRGDWLFRGQFCTIQQLSSLASWLDAVAAGEQPEICYVGGFICHELLFHVQGGGHFTDYEETFAPPTSDVFRLTFGGSTRPPWCGNEWGSMDFPIEESDLRAMATEVREQLRAHPPR